MKINTDQTLICLDCEMWNTLFNEDIPETIWLPPPPGRFFQLTSEDEVWARKLGLGTVLTFHEYVAYLSQKLMEQITAEIMVPAEVFSDFVGGSYTGSIRNTW